MFWVRIPPPPVFARRDGRWAKIVTAQRRQPRSRTSDQRTSAAGYAWASHEIGIPLRLRPPQWPTGEECLGAAGPLTSAQSRRVTPGQAMKSVFHYVYLLRSIAEPDRHYVGMTTDLETRLETQWWSICPHGQIPPLANRDRHCLSIQGQSGGLRALSQIPLRPRLRQEALLNGFRSAVKGRNAPSASFLGSYARQD